MSRKYSHPASSASWAAACAGPGKLEHVLHPKRRAGQEMISVECCLLCKHKHEKRSACHCSCVNDKQIIRTQNCHIGAIQSMASIALRNWPCPSVQGNCANVSELTLVFGAGMSERGRVFEFNMCESNNKARSTSSEVCDAVRPWEKAIKVSNKGNFCSLFQRPEDKNTFISHMHERTLTLGAISISTVGPHPSPTARHCNHQELEERPHLCPAQLAMCPYPL